MGQINILIVIDTAGTLATNNLMNNVYLIDTNGFVGSWNEGSSTLVTVCQDGQILDWSISSVSPGNDVNITGFTGQMVTSKVCTPQSSGIDGAEIWTGRVQTRGGIGFFAYTVQLTLNGKMMQFNGQIKVV